MQLIGQCVFLETRNFTPEGKAKLNFAVFGFPGDYDRREVAVSEELLPQLPTKKDVPVHVMFQINKRFDGKEDIKMLSCKVV